MVRNDDVHTLDRVPASAVRSRGDQIPLAHTAKSNFENCIHELIEAQARRTPEAVAVRAAGKTLTYHALTVRAQQIARRLRHAGVGRGSLVALLADRSFDMLVGLLGILKAGGAYIPLDPEHPSTRLQFILGDSRPAALLAQRHLTDAISAGDLSTVWLDDGAAPGDRTEPFESAGVSAADLAYVMYTSGSTGQPKGVMLEHRSVVNQLRWMQSYFGLSGDDRVLLKTTYSFDVSCWELMWPLIAGAQIVVAEPGAHRDHQRIAQLIEETGVTLLQFVPSVLRTFLDTDNVERHCRSLKTVLAIGEALTPDLVAKYYRRLSVPLMNLYGPTEAAIAATVWPCPSGRSLKSVPIGRAIDNVIVRVLDSALEPVAPGAEGELCIGGLAVARGYLGRPDLTAEKFVSDPSGTPGDRIYRTGDLARFRVDGDLEFLGRIDRQVKMRGFRIELGEIETHLSSHPAIDAAVVIARPFTGPTQRLVGYFVPKPGLPVPDAEELRQHLRTWLPEYMVPGALLSLRALPLTSNGKLDVAALPDPQEIPATAAARAHGGAVETLLCESVADILGIAHVSTGDNIFLLGADSLSAIRLVSRIKSRIGISLPIRDVFEAATLRELAERISAAKDQQTDDLAPPLVPVERNGALPLSPAQQRLWFMQQLAPASGFYNITVAARIRGPLDAQALEASLAALLSRHEALRTVFPTIEGVPGVHIVHEGRASIERGSVEHDNLRRAVELIASWGAIPFDLARDLPVRFRLVTLGPDDAVLAATVHHIVSDNWSMATLGRDLAAFYESALAGSPVRLPQLPVQYADFAVWQDKWLAGPIRQQQTTYWRGRLSGVEPLSLPLDRPRSRTRGLAGREHELAIPAATTLHLEQRAYSDRLTMFLLMLSAFFVFLRQLTGDEDLTVGTVSSGRVREEVEDIVGFFVNTLPIRMQVDGGLTFESFASQLRDTMFDALANQDLPFDSLVKAVNPKRDPGRNPIFQVLFAFDDSPWRNFELAGLDVTEIEIPRTSSHFDLAVHGRNDGSRLVFVWRYATDLFDESTVRRWSDVFAHLLDRLAEGKTGTIQSF